jgi:dihydrofolate reductase
MISIIVAMDKNRLIGGENKLLWNIPGELKRFKEITTGHPIIMGRKTHQSIGRVLPNRTNIIITRDPDYKVEGAIVVNSLEQAIKAAENVIATEVKQSEPPEIFVIGGGQIYQQALPLADRLYVTVVDGEYEGDTYFPDYSEFSHATDRQEFLGEPSYQTLSLEKP